MKNKTLRNSVSFASLALKKISIPVITIIILLLLIFILSDEPITALYYFFLGPFRNIYSFGNMLNAAVPLILGGLGVAIAMKAGHLNLGGEGQIYLGAFATTAAALQMQSLGAFGAVLAVILGCLSSGAMAAVSGFCKAVWKTNELITSFLLSLAAIPAINYFVSGPFLDPETSLISTNKIAESMRLPRILKHSNLNAGLFIALFFAVLVYFFLSRSKTGYEFRMAGSNELFARYGGINIKLNAVLSMAFSGALYGLAGSAVILGTHYSVIKDFSAGLGWNALSAALISNFNPIGIIPSAFFIAWINSGARVAMQNTGLASETAVFAQAVILFLVTCKKFFNKGKING